MASSHKQKYPCLAVTDRISRLRSSTNLTNFKRIVLCWALSSPAVGGWWEWGGGGELAESVRANFKHRERFHGIDPFHGS